MKKTFEVRLESKGPGGAWTFMPIPFDAAETFRSRARIAVAGTMNGFAFQSSLMPEGDGSHAMAVSKALQHGAKARAGDVVSVTLWRDERPRMITAPADLQAALDTHPEAAKLFEVLPYSHRKEYIDWIDAAKQASTRVSRISKAVAMLAAGGKRMR